MLAANPFGPSFGDLQIPDNTFIAHMEGASPMANPGKAILESLSAPIASESLAKIAKGKKDAKKAAKAVIVVSDNTRPVPYKGEEGILMPVIDTLMDAGFKADEITVLIATGMHRPMAEGEIRSMLDSRVFDLGIKVVNHEPKNDARLSFLGMTKRGTKVMIDSVYTEADLKIATGLVESHFMAGASGGRKAICPGIIGEESTFIFHGPALMDDENSRDLVIEGNPVHEESLEVARMAGVDFIVNVTLDHSFHVTGVFSGDLEKAHLAAVEHIRKDVEVAIPAQADIVITHAGFVGINHYQAAKCGVASLGALKKDGYLITIANCTDQGNVIGSANYRTALALLHLDGPDKFNKLLRSPDWVFLPEQWQVQEWAKVFRRIPENHYYFFAPQIPHREFDLLPGIDIRTLGNEDEKDKNVYSRMVELAISDIEKRTGKKREDMKIIYIADGPYEIPVVKEG